MSGKKRRSRRRDAGRRPSSAPPPSAVRDPEELLEELRLRPHDTTEEALQLVLEITAICTERLRAADSLLGVEETLRIFERTAEAFPDGPLHHYFALGSGVALLEAFKARRDPSYLEHALDVLRRAQREVASDFGTALTRYALAQALLTAYEAGEVATGAVEEAITLLSAAARQRDPRYPRRTELVRLLAVAQSIRYRAHAGERDAAEEFRSALSQLTQQRARESKASSLWQELANTHGWMLLTGFNVEGRQDDLEEAVRVLGEALASGTHDRRHVLIDDVVPDTRRNLAEALFNRALSTRRSQDLDSAVGHIQSELVHCRPASRPDLLQFLARVSVVRYDAQGDRNDLDRALSAGELALGVLPSSSGSTYTSALGWVAGLRSALHVRTGEWTHVDRSVGLWREAALAAAARSGGSQEFLALGDCLALRLLQHPAGEPDVPEEHLVNDLQTALGAFDRASRLASDGSQERHEARRHAVLALLAYGASTGDSGALQQARRLGEDFLHECEEPEQRTQFGLLCAKAWSALTDLEGDDKARDRAVQLHRATAATLGWERSDLAPAAEDSGFAGDLALESHDWLRAAEAYTRAQRGTDSPSPQRPWHTTLRSHLKRRAGTGLAYAYVRQGRLADAFLTLEEVCAGAESLGPALPWGSEARLVPPAPLAEIQQRLDDRQVVHLFATVEGGAALITEKSGTRAVLLPGLDAHRVSDLSRRLQTAATRRRSSMRWASALEETCAELWNLCLRAVTQAVDAQRPVVLVPTGHLRVLPLHAAFWEDPNSPSRRRHVLDELQLSYAPSASCLAMARSPRRFRVDVRVFGSAQQSEAAAAPWLQPSDLWEGILNRTSLSDALGNESCVVHFTGHGSTNPLSPLDSWITLDDGPLTVRGMLAQGIRSDLVILSSCDSGTFGSTALTDPFPLPYSLVISGAKGCVAALWQPGDTAVRLLTSLFYEEWENRPPAQALRAAQLRLRDTTNAEVITYLPELADTAPRGIRARARWARMKPFAGIGHWGAFLYAGT